MRAGRILTAAASLGLALGALACTSASAQASTKPSVSLKFATNKVTASKTMTVDVSTKDLPRGTTLYLQWQVGSKHVWTRYRVLGSTAGTSVVKAPDIGKYEFRVLASTKKATVTSSSDEVLYSYGTVTLTDFCNEAIQCNDSGNVQIGSTDYTYAEYWNTSDTYPQWGEAANLAQNTSCRSATLTFAGSGDFDGAASFVTYEKIVQTKSQATQASTAPNTIGTLTVTLDGGPWIQDISTSDTGINANVYLNGTFSCYTPTGL